MESKKFLNDTVCIVLVAAALLLSACAPASRPVPSESSPQTPSTPEAPPPALQEKRARSSAAAALIDQGRALLDKGEADAAIRVLGQAANLDSSNGALYFYMAEAWLMKQNEPQARDYNRLAESYLGGDPNWMLRIARQSDRIDELQK